MKKLKLNKTGFAGAEVLSRAQLKKVMGGGGDDDFGSSGPRCKSDVFCSIYQGGDGVCMTMETGQCRCVKYNGGSASESVPDSYCLRD